MKNLISHSIFNIPKLSLIKTFLFSKSNIRFFTIIPKISYTVTATMDNGPPNSNMYFPITMYHKSQLSLARRASGVKYLLVPCTPIIPIIDSCESQTLADLRRIRLTPFLTCQSIQTLVLMLIYKGIIRKSLSCSHIKHFHYHPFSKLAHRNNVLPFSMHLLRITFAYCIITKPFEIPMHLCNITYALSLLQNTLQMPLLHSMQLNMLRTC